MATYSTGEAAEKIGVSRQTLQAWIDKRSISAPKLARVGRISVRLWTDKDIEKGRKFKAISKAAQQKKTK